MWRRIVVGNEKPCVILENGDVKEVYNRESLELNIENCTKMLNDEPDMDSFKRAIITEAISSLKQGLSLLT